MVYLILADGFEDIEAVATVDILRRCGIQVELLSITGKRVITGAHGLVTKVDTLFRKNHIIRPEALILPGGLRGAQTMAENNVLRLTLQQQAYQGSLIAAICAAPMVLAKAGILNNRHATIYPSMQSNFDATTIYHPEAFVVKDGHIITAQGPAATPLFALTIARQLLPDNPEIIERVAHDMLISGYEAYSHNVFEA